MPSLEDLGEAGPHLDQAAELIGGSGQTGMVVSVEVSGAGFLNLELTNAAILRQLTRRAADARLGVPATDAGRVTVIDYSQPNIAKEMHVGHLRSTIIGDALVRILEFDGAKVIRQNHLGDWGTQFGMLIQYLVEHPEAHRPAGGQESGSQAISRLDALYRAARVTFDGDPDFADRARRRVVSLQAGDADTLAGWEEIFEPHRLCSYLYTLAQAFTDFYEACPVLRAPTEAVRDNRVAICRLTGDTLELGLKLLGIAAPDRL